MKLKFNFLTGNFTPKNKETKAEQREINFFRNINGRYFRYKLIRKIQSKK